MMKRKTAISPLCLKVQKREGIDINDDVAATNFAERIREKVMTETKKLIPDGVRLFFNGSNQYFGCGYNTHFEVDTLKCFLYINRYLSLFLKIFIGV